MYLKPTNTGDTTISGRSRGEHGGVFHPHAFVIPAPAYDGARPLKGHPGSVPVALRGHPGSIPNALRGMMSFKQAKGLGGLRGATDYPAVATTSDMVSLASQYLSASACAYSDLVAAFWNAMQNPPMIGGDAQQIDPNWLANLVASTNATAAQRDAATQAAQQAAASAAVAAAQQAAQAAAAAAAQQAAQQAAAAAAAAAAQQAAQQPAPVNTTAALSPVPITVSVPAQSVSAPTPQAATPVVTQAPAPQPVTAVASPTTASQAAASAQAAAAQTALAIANAQAASATTPAAQALAQTAQLSATAALSQAIQAGAQAGITIPADVAATPTNYGGVLMDPVTGQPVAAAAASSLPAFLQNADGSPNYILIGAIGAGIYLLAKKR